MEVIALVLGAISVSLAVIAIVQAYQFNRSTEKLIQTEDERVKQLIQTEDERVKKLITEWREEHAENEIRFQQMMEQWQKEHEETLRYIANLISIKSEEIKEVVK